MDSKPIIADKNNFKHASIGAYSPDHLARLANRMTVQSLSVMAEGPSSQLAVQGDAFCREKKFEAAVRCYRNAIRLSPERASLHVRLAKALCALKAFTESMESCQAALRIQSDHFEARRTLAAGFFLSGAARESIHTYQLLVRDYPGHADLCCDLGIVLSRSGKLFQAEEACRQSIEIEPDHADAASCLAYLHLRAGKLRSGFMFYESRFRASQYPDKPIIYEPRWYGDSLNGERILLHAEQGLGDTIQFVRYVPLVAARGGRVVLEVHPELVSLLSGLEGIEQIIPRGALHPPVACQCPLMSLPLAFGTRLETIPARVCYIQAQPARVKSILTCLAGNRDLKVGLSWAGNPHHNRDNDRSIALNLLAPLGTLPNVSLVSLQKGPARAQINNRPTDMRLMNFGAECEDLVGTAAAIMAVDVVITVDTAIAHLAGALGKPVWILLCYIADWRWFTDREDSPWYPTARLFRQDHPGDWGGVVSRVAAELRKLAADRPPNEHEQIIQRTTRSYCE